MFIGAPAVFLIGERYYFFINPQNSRGDKFAEKNKVDHKSPFTECGLY
jgi:hypothetical protein